MPENPMMGAAPLPDVLQEIASGGADDLTGSSPFGQGSTLRPLYVVRRRLQDLGVWGALSAALVKDHPDKLLTLLSTETLGMVDVTDPDVIAMVQLVGADPAEVLA